MIGAELKAKWLEALRSGRYPKGTFTYFKNGRYCALGVGIELQNKDPACWNRPALCVTFLNMLDADYEGPYELMHFKQITNLSDRNPTFDEAIAYIEEHVQ